MSDAGCRPMPSKQSLLSDEAPRFGKAPAACWVLPQARGWFTLSVDQPTDGGGGGGSSTHRNQGTARLEDSEIAWSRLTKPNDLLLATLVCVQFSFLRQRPRAPEHRRSLLRHP